MYKIETITEYLNRGGKIIKLRSANAVRNAYPQRPVDAVKLSERLKNWRVA